MAPDSANVVPGVLGAPVLGVSVHQPCLVSGEQWVLSYFVALGSWAHPLVSLSLRFFILQVAVTAWLLWIKCAGLAHSWWVK